MNDQRPLPPFGRVLLAYQQETIRLDHPIYIYIGKEARDEAYTQKRMGTLCSYLPNNDDVSRYTWPIYGQHIIVYDTGGLSSTTLHKICFHLLRFGPRVLYFWSEEHPCQFFKGAKS
jgi:hypothetical protein